MTSHSVNGAVPALWGWGGAVRAGGVHTTIPNPPLPLFAAGAGAESKGSMGSLPSLAAGAGRTPLSFGHVLWLGGEINHADKLHELNTSCSWYGVRSSDSLVVLGL